MARRKTTAKRRKPSKPRSSRQGLEIVAAPLTRSGYEYLTAVWPALLQGGIGSLEIKPDALLLLEALNAVATGGAVEEVQVNGGEPEELNNLLNQSLADANYINDALGTIQIRS